MGRRPDLGSLWAGWHLNLGVSPRPLRRCPQRNPVQAVSVSVAAKDCLFGDKKCVFRIKILHSVLQKNHSIVSAGVFSRAGQQGGSDAEGDVHFSRRRPQVVLNLRNFR